MHVLQRLQQPGIEVAPDCTIQQAAVIMNDAGVGTVAVVDGDLLLGIATDRDIVRRAVARGLPLDGRVDGVMSFPVHTVDAADDVARAVSMFGTVGVRRLAVVDEGRFIGILSLDDLLVDLAGQLAIIAAPLASEIAIPHRDSSVPATVPPESPSTG